MAGRKVLCATPFWLCPIWAIFRDFQTLQIFETRDLCSVEMEEEERIDSKPPTPIPAGQPISWNLLRIRFLGQLRSRFDPGKQSAQVLFPTLRNWVCSFHTNPELCAAANAGFTTETDSSTNTHSFSGFQTLEYRSQNDGAQPRARQRTGSTIWKIQQHLEVSQNKSSDEEM